MESNSKLYLLVLYIAFLAPFLLRGLTWAMLYVWTKNYPQVVGTCSGHHGQLISQNCVLTKIRAEPPPPPPLKPLYGLSDSCRKWYFTLKNALCEVGLKMSQYDKAMFYLFDTKLQGVVIIHVDDLLYAGTTKFQDMMKKISQRFKISKSEQGVFRYIGMDLSSNQNEINLSQKSYCSLVQMVKIDYERKKQTEKYLTEDEIKMYQSLLGKLNWLACNSRPDLKFEVFLHAQFKKPKVKQLISLNKVVKQLVGGPEKIIFPKLDVANLRLLCYTDASLGNLENNVRSCKAFVIFLADRERCGALAWNSKKIDRICDNTLEAEARALKYGMTYAIAIRYTLKGINKIFDSNILLHR